MQNASRKAQSYKNTYRETKNLQSREHLLKSALELFAEQGYKAVTIKQIGVHANITASLIYYYFDDKEEIFHESIKYLIDHVGDHYLDLVSEAHEPHNMLDSWFKVQKELALEIQRLVKIILDYSSSQGKSVIVDKLISQFYDKEKQIIAEAVQQGIDAGIFRDCNASELAVFASIHLDGLITRSLIKKESDITEGVDYLHNLMLEQLGYS